MITSSANECLAYCGSSVTVADPPLQFARRLIVGRRTVLVGCPVAPPVFPEICLYRTCDIVCGWRRPPINVCVQGGGARVRDWSTEVRTAFLGRVRPTVRTGSRCRARRFRRQVADHLEAEAEYPRMNSRPDSMLCDEPFPVE